MEILEAFYRRKLKKKQKKKSEMFHSEVELNRAPSLTSVGTMATSGGAMATGLITRVLRLTRRRDSSSRPHSWHSTKVGDGSSESMDHTLDRMSSYHTSATDLISGLDSSAGGFLRGSGDQYSSRGSMESLEPAPGSQVCSGRAHLPLSPHSSSSCHQLSSTRSSSIDLLHSKRDSAYSSFSTSLSFPECLGLSSERSFSLESVPQTADIRSAHDMPHGSTLEQETLARIRFREQQVGGAHGSSGGELSNRHSLGPIWSSGISSCESLKGAPAPPRRNDSYTVTRQERPSSWSSLEQARSLRSLQKGSWHHSSGSVATAAKSLYITEGQLHTVIEKSPESSPTTRPRQAQSPGPPQDPPCPPITIPGPNPGLYPTRLRENQNGYQPTSTAAESDRSFEDHRVQSDMCSRVTQGQVPHGYPHPLPCQSPADSQALPIQSHVCPQDPAPQSAVYSERPVAAPHYCQPELSEREHPLTRLEMALAEVQVSGGGPSENVPAPTMPSLSVLEKVSRFEHRERATKQRSLSSRHRSSPHQVSDKSQNTPCGAEDLRNMLERSTNGTKTCRTLSHRGGSHEKHRSPADPSSALQRSRSSFHMEWPREDCPHGQDGTESVNMWQELSTKRSYRGHPKDPSKVFRSTSFRCRDLSCTSSTPLPPPPVPPKVHSFLDKRDTKHLPLAEKKGPKTLPKPQGVVFTSTGPSPHTPKECLMVSPELRDPSPPTLPSLPPLGPPPLTRICGRKRLTSDQKKRSFSEPESMNEIGVTDPETTALIRCQGSNGMDTTVADRRRMFEQVARGVAGGPCGVTGGAPVQEALLEFVERKYSEKRDDRRQRSSQRPHSAVLQPLPMRSDSASLLSSSSLLSLQDCAPEMHHFSGEWPMSSPLATGEDLRSFQSNVFYPGRVTSPRAPALQPPSPESASSLGKDIHQPPPVPQSLFLSQELDRVLQRAGSVRSSGRCSSSEDLLERTKSFSPVHSRSRSSPTGGTVEQGMRMIAGGISEVESPALAAHRAPDVASASDIVSPLPPESPKSGPLLVSVLRRERSRPSEGSTLAASVGLPCPMSGSGAVEWTSTERLSQANLDAITFPGQSSPSAANRSETLVSNRNETSVSNKNETLVSNRNETLVSSRNETLVSSRNETLVSNRNETSVSSRKETSVSSRKETSVSNRKETWIANKNERTDRQSASGDHQEENQGQTFSLETKHNESSSNGADGENRSTLFVQRQMSSLRISESNLQLDPLFTDHSDEYDEVFVQSPATHTTSRPIKDLSEILEDFPAAPSPVQCSFSESNITLASSRKPSAASPPSSPSGSPPPPPPPVLKTQPTALPVLAASRPDQVTDCLVLEYEPVPVRLRSPEEQRVQVLVFRLVRCDRTLEPLLDTWGKSTVDVLVEIFPNSRLVEKLSHQHRDSRFRSQGPADESSEPSEDQDQSLISRKVELCEALSSCIDSLQREKEALGDEFRAHRELGNRVDVWVQEHCKDNERTKYSMFIGDLECVVNLLLSLCGRLARMERSLASLQRQEPTEGSTELWDSLRHKRSLLLRQTEDALELKENLERRQCTVHAFLRRSLDPSQLQEYRRLVRTKPPLLIVQRRLDDIVRQTEEQLSLLLDTLPLELTQARGWSRTGLVLSPSPCPLSHMPPSIPGPTHIVPRPAHLTGSATVTSL